MNQFDTAFDNDILYGMVNSSETLSVNKDGERFVNEQNIGYGAYVGGALFYSLYTSDMVDVLREQAGLQQGRHRPVHEPHRCGRRHPRRHPDDQHRRGAGGRYRGRHRV